METTFAKIKATALLPALVFASSPYGTTAEGTSASVINAEYTINTSIASRITDDLPKANETIVLREAPTEWTSKMDKRFNALALREALEELTPAEYTELEQLTETRRNLEYPRSAEEILWEYKQRQITANLVRALKEYASFHTVSD